MTSKKPIEITISYIFRDNDWRSITVFKKRAQELVNVKILNDNKVKISAKIKDDKESGLKIIAQLPNEDLLKELYMAFRFFYLKKEPSNFNKVANIIKRASNDKYFNGYIDHLKKQWSGALQRDNFFGIYITPNNGEISTRRLLDLWFNAHYFHSNEEKEKKLALLNRFLSIDFSRFLLVNSVCEASNAVLRLYESVATLENLGKSAKT